MSSQIKMAVFTVSMIFIFVITNLVATASDYDISSDMKVWVNNREIKTDVKVINGTVYVPVRTLGEALGAKVKLDQNAKTVELLSGKNDDLIPQIIEDVSPWVVGIIGNRKDPGVTSDQYYEQIIHGTEVIIKENDRKQQYQGLRAAS